MNDIQHKLIRRQVRLLGHAKLLNKEFSDEMQLVDDKYLARIGRLLDSMTDRDKLFFQQNKKTTRAARLRELLDNWAREYRDILKADMSTAYDSVYEVERKAVKQISDKEVVKEVQKPPKLIMGLTVSATAATSALRWRKYVDNKTKQGFANNYDVRDLLVGTARSRQKDGAVYTRNRSAAAHLQNAVMTGVNDGTITAYQEMGVSDLKWVATLDGSTCMQCASLDGKVFKLGEYFAYPPLHPNCACKVVQDFGETEGATRGSFPDKAPGRTPRPKYIMKDGKKIKNPDRIEAGTVSGNVKFKDWLPMQSDDFQKEYLGPTRHKLYKEGKIKLENFTNKYGRMYTLEELGVQNSQSVFTSPVKF